MLIALGTQSATSPLPGTTCLLLVQPTATIPLMTDGLGQGTTTLPLPTRREEIHVQALQQTPGLEGPVLSASPALRLPLGPESDGSTDPQSSPACIRYQPWDIVAIAISSTDKVYAFYDDRRRSVGSSLNLGAHEGPRAYSLPPGYSPQDIVGIGISSTDRVYTFYRDGKRSIGTSLDLDAHEAPVSYDLPDNVLVDEGDIAGIAIAKSNDWVYTWWKPSQGRSIGWSRDLGSRDRWTHYDASPRNGYQIVGIGISKSDQVYTWYSDRTRSVGWSLDLHANVVLPAPQYTLPCKP